MMTDSRSDTFTQLVHQHAGMVYSAARRQVHDPALADDISQAVFLLLWQKLPAIRRHDLLAAWLLRATFYASDRAITMRSRRVSHERKAATMRSESNPPTPNELWADVAPRLDAALQKLSAADREAVALHYLQNLTLADVGQHLGISEEAARKRIARALPKLHRLLAAPASAPLGLALCTHALTPIPNALLSSLLATPTATIAATVIALAKSVSTSLAFAKAKLVATLACLVAVIGGVIIAAPQLATQPAPQAPTLSLQALVDGVSARSLDLSVAHFKLKMKGIDCQSPGGPPLSLPDFSYNVWKSGEKAACDIQIQWTKGVAGPRTEHSRWDGRRGMGYVEIPQASPDRRFSGSVLSYPNNLLSAFCLRMITHEEPFDARMSLAELFRQGRWEIVGARDIGGYRAWGVRQTSWDDVKFSKSKINGKSDVLFEVWLAPENGFAPLEINERWADSNAPLEQMQDVTLSKQDGVWIVSKATLAYTKPGSSQWTAKYLYEVTEFSRQLPPDASFTIKFPVGTGVLDDITHTSFIAGKVVQVTDKSGVMHHEPIDDYPEYRAMTDYSRGISEAEWLQCPASKIPIERSHAAPGAGSGHTDAAKAERDQLVGKAAPEFPKTQWLQSRPLTLEDLKGKVVLVDFFADWCGPCRNDFPQLAELFKGQKENGLTIIAIHPAGSEVASIEKVLKDFSLAYPVCVDTASAKASGTLYDQYHINRIPYTFVLDREGKIAAHGDLRETLPKALQLAGGK